MIVGKSLAAYTAKKPKEREIELIIPSEEGFYKTEGRLNGNTIIKSKEIEYSKSRDFESTYFEYEKGASKGYTYNPQKKSWFRNAEYKSGILRLTEI